MLKLITSEDCPPCRTLKYILKKHKIMFEEIPLESDEAKKLLGENKFMAVPILMKNGKPILVGLPVLSEKEIVNMIRCKSDEEVSDLR